MLAVIDGPEQADVARRVAVLADIAPAPARTIADVVRQRLSSVVAQRSSTAGGTGALAQILTSAGRSTERQVLDQLARADPELAAEVRDLMFTFEDIAGLDDRVIQLVLRELDPQGPAARAARRRVIEEAQGRIVAVIRRLEASDAIGLGLEGADELL